MGSIKKNKFGLIKGPIITEKGALASSVDNCVVFSVHPKANKLEIKSAVESIFDVKVKSVRTMNCDGKLKRVGRNVGHQRNWKKAYISLQEGSSIDFIEGL